MVTPSSARADAKAAPEGEAAKSRRSVAPRSIRGRVVAGILLIIPVLITLFLIRYVYAAALTIGARLVSWLARLVIWAFDLKESAPKFNPAEATWYESLLAVVLTVVMLYLLGWLGTNAVGRRIIELVEKLVQRIPFVDTVYGAVKRMVQALSGTGAGGGVEQKVVLIDFPTDKMRAVAFMTNVITDTSSGKRYATVFVPTAPNPTSGYMELVPIEDVTPTDMSVESGLSMILSGGASAPPNITFLKRGSLVQRLSPETGPGTRSTGTA